ncbi:MAG: diguanylate cyclase [Wenzhouxiangella sp.]|nr:MAG: diguanylate cyclase [Wenzhouxiangella sp.]
MENNTQTIDLDLLRDASRSSPDPLAICNEQGSILFINEAMQAFIDNGELAEKTMARLADPESPRLLRLQQNEHSPHRRLLRIPFGQFQLIILIEHDEDPRIDRLRQRLDEALKLSITDPLTGAWNRHQFNELIRIEVPRAKRYGQPICLLLIDIDHFKKVNDDLGHAAGDQTLQQLCSLIREQIRLVDSLFRWGGEEFAVLLPNTSLAAAHFVGERLRKAVAGSRFEPAGAVTVSIGIAELERDETAQQWFERTDQALFAAKEQGRNRVVCADSDPDRLIGSPAGESPFLLAWKSSYESGHPLIDEQHQELFRLGNRLIAASLDSDTAPDEFVDLMDVLIEHAAQHFHDEENIMAELEYEHLARHRRAHNGLVERARQLRERACNGTVSTGQVVRFLANDLVRQHMLTEDVAFFPSLNTSAVQHD